MERQLVTLFGVLLSLGLVSSAHAGQAYVAIDLNPSGLVQSQATGVAGAQQVGFGFGGATFGGEHAVLWAGSAASTVDLHPTGYHQSNALATSGSAQVGWAIFPETGTRHAMLWTGSAGSAVDLHPDGFGFSRAVGVVDGVQVGSGGGPSTGFIDHALLWTGSANNVVDLNPPGFFSSQARGVSLSQQVGVGNFGRALLWTGTAESAIDLTPFWCVSAEAFGVSGGQQVGSCFTPGGNHHALLWTGSAASAVDLHPIGFSISRAHAVAGGRQVGFGASPGGNTRALVWEGTAESVVDLNAFLPEGFTEAVALGIDQWGNIVGYARGPASNALFPAFLWAPTYEVRRMLTALGPASLWVGLKNSDAVGLRLDLRAEVLVNGVVVGSGELKNVGTGSSGFNNALLQSMAMTLSAGPVELPPGGDLSLRTSARRTCFGRGHNSGTARQWFNGQAIDSGPGRDAGSRVRATIAGVTSSYFLRDGFALNATAGSARQFVDGSVNSSVSCPGRPFVPFNVWTMTLP